MCGCLLCAAESEAAGQSATGQAQEDSQGTRARRGDGRHPRPPAPQPGGAAAAGARAGRAPGVHQGLSYTLLRTYDPKRSCKAPWRSHKEPLRGHDAP